jgi:hypothetical protein
VVLSNDGCEVNDETPTDDVDTRFPSRLGFSSAIFGQSRNIKKPFVVGAENNESAKASLDLLAETAGRDKLIILIAKLGTFERSRNLSRNRLRTAREYLEKTRAFPSDRLVSAFGDRASEEGRIEVYLDNHLFMVFLFKRYENFAREP